MDANELAELRLKAKASWPIPGHQVLALLGEVDRLTEAVEFRETATKRAATYISNLGRNLDTALAARDAAVARAEKAERTVEHNLTEQLALVATVQRVRAVADGLAEWGGESPEGAAWEIRRALDGEAP